MSKAAYAHWQKAVAVLLSTVTLFLCAACAFGTLYMASVGYYTDPLDTVRETEMNRKASVYCTEILIQYCIEQADLAEKYQESNLLFTLSGDDGEVLATNAAGVRSTIGEYTRSFEPNSLKYYWSDIDEYEAFPKERITVHLTVRRGLPYVDDFYRTNVWVQRGYHMRVWIPVCMCVAFISWVGLLIYLFNAVGRHAEEKVFRGGGLERVPLDLFLLLAVLLSAGFIEALQRISWYTLLGGTLNILCLIGLYLTVLGTMLSITTRVKIGCFWSNTLLYILGKGFVEHISRIWRILLTIPLVLGAEVFWVIASGGYRWMLTVLIALDVILFTVLFYRAAALQSLENAGRRMADGNLDEEVDLTRLHGAFRRYGETINRVQQGMALAVDEKMKSERFKTELITNVSHDIKTPLTSIINYTDLISKAVPEDETVRGYAEVLNRQAVRMKKLMEDLVEASKAVTGNLRVELAPLTVDVLLDQTVGEFEEKLEAQQLTLCRNQPEEPVQILADGRHLWRVMDNLLNNVCKYAMPGTRVYLDLTADEKTACIVLRNISKTPLHVSSEALLERFTRGDSSRNTEGSGLGLSIAKSLVELQHGKLDLIVDGDLFKVIITFGRLTMGKEESKESL